MTDHNDTGSRLHRSPHRGSLTLRGLLAPLALIWNSLVEWDYRRRFSLRDRITLYRMLHHDLKIGVSVQNSLQKFLDIQQTGAGTPSPAVYAARQWLDRMTGLGAGKTLSEAAADWIGEIDRLLLETGEKTGKQSEILLTLLDMTQREIRMRRSFRSALNWPATVLVLNLVMIAILDRFVLPNLLPMIDLSRLESPALETILIIQTVGSHLPAILAGAVILYYLFMRGFPTWTGPLRDWCDRNLLPYRLYLLDTGSRFLFAAAALQQAGTPPTAQADILSRDQQPWLKWRVAEAEPHLEKAASLFSALLDAGSPFPDREINVTIRLLETSGSHLTAIRTVADYWSEVCVERMEVMSARLSMGMGIFVLLLDVMLMIGILSITGGIEAVSPY